ncbi:MAG: DUF615 domain-containing protein [Gammaproteobacteria bacterium]|nr:DUF615 domain-containing protein [Gammaproteobacteria bacterium]
MSETDENELPDEKSKSQLKREATALQKLGMQLTELSEETLKQLSLPENLLSAILAAKKIHQRGGHKRQLQYIGKVMRQIDPAPVEQAMSNLKQQQKRDNNRFHQLESYRDRLIEGAPDLMNEIFGLYPDLDSQHLRQLIRNAQHEKKHQKPPKSARALFKYLKDLDDENA